MKNKWLFWLSLIAFIAFFVSSIVWESPLLLYIASALPILVVFAMPDFGKGQRLLAGRDAEIVKLAGGSGQPEWLIVSFKPGTICWGCRTLTIPYEKAPVVEGVLLDASIVALTVLPHDLYARPRRGHVRLRLAQLAERTNGMPFAVQDINRFVLTLADFAEAPAAAASIPAPVASLASASVPVPAPVPASVPAPVAQHNVELQA